MDSPSFSVTPNFLIFPKNQITTLVIKVTGKNLDCKHSLPSCFTIVYPFSPRFTGSGEISVTYNGLSEANTDSLSDIFILDASGCNVLKVKVFVGDQANECERDIALLCKICLQEYTEEGAQMPMMLSGCGHTVCQDCTMRLKQQYISHSLICPFDRTGPHVKTFKNFTVIEMIREKNEMEKIKQMAVTGSSASPIVPCYENVHHEATHHCTTCLQDFCQNCFATTHAARIFKTHKSVSVANKPIQHPKCKTHPKLEAEFVCMNHSCIQHGEFLCHGCAERPKLHVKCKMRSSRNVIREHKEKFKRILRRLNNNEKRWSRNVSKIKARREEFRKLFGDGKGVITDEKLASCLKDCESQVELIKNKTDDVSRVLGMKHKFYFNSFDGLMKEAEQICNKEPIDLNWDEDSSGHDSDED